MQFVVVLEVEFVLEASRAELALVGEVAGVGRFVVGFVVSPVEGTAADVAGVLAVLGGVFLVLGEVQFGGESLEADLALEWLFIVVCFVFLIC